MENKGKQDIDVERLLSEAIRRGTDKRLMDRFDAYVARRERARTAMRRAAAVALILVSATAIAMTASPTLRHSLFPTAPTATETPAPTRHSTPKPTAPEPTPTTAPQPQPTVATAPQPQPPAAGRLEAAHYDLEAVSPSGHTLYYTIADPTARTLSVGGMGSPRYRGHLVVPDTVSLDGQAYTVTTLADSAFYGQPRLRSVALPRTLVRVGRDAFGGCYSLDSVSIHSPQPPAVVGQWCFMDIDTSATLAVPAGSGNAYRAAYGWDWFARVLDPDDKPVTVDIHRGCIHVEGVWGEEVRIYSHDGHLIETKICYGECYFGYPYSLYGHESRTFTVIVGNRPPVTIDYFGKYRR